MIAMASTTQSGAPGADGLLRLAQSGALIPAELRALKRWAPWAAVWNARREKWDKIPRQPRDPQYGLSTVKPARWGSFDQTLAALAKHPGVLHGAGLCLTGIAAEAGVVGIDIDNCLDEAGNPSGFAQVVMEMLPSYTEVSPSGRGLRIVGLGSLEFDWTNHDVGIEVYAGHEPRFLTLTGHHVAGTPAELALLDPFALEDLTAQYAKKRERAEVIDLTMPDVAEGLSFEGLALPARVRTFLETGEVDGDRSGTLHAAGVALYAAGLDDASVLSVLATNEHAMAVALDHRRQDHDRAMLYLWREHCLKAKGKGQGAIAALDEFDLAPAGPAGEQAKPSPKLQRDKAGRIEATIDNLTCAVAAAHWCGIDVRYDAFRDEIVWAPDGTAAQWRPLKDEDSVRLRVQLERRGFKPIGRELMRDALLMVAMDNQIDTAQVWLDGLEWDGTPRIDLFLTTYFRAEDSPYTRAVSSYLWTALAGRVIEPGCKADMVPILVGGQGIGKSTGVAALAPAADFFTEVSLHEKDDDLSRRMRGRLVAEIGELRGLHTKEMEAIKTFITRTHESWVPKFREFATQFPRRLVFVGTTNQEQFLADETGNRRWLPVTLTQAVDVAAIARDRLQLWAEARERFALCGVEYAQAQQLAEAVHASHMIVDPWTDRVDQWLEEADPLTEMSPRACKFLRVRDVLRGALGIEDKAIGRREELRAAAVLRALGYSRKKVRESGRTMWAYVPVGAAGSPLRFL